MSESKKQRAKSRSHRSPSKDPNAAHRCSLIVFIIVRRLGLLYAASFYS